MLKIIIPAEELWDEKNECFITSKGQVLQLEHSLVSVSKWESKWCKPFLGKDDNRTAEQMLDYIKCMTITQNVDDSIYQKLTQQNINEINEYIDAPMTATWFSEDKSSKKGGRGEVITNELIYYWMISLQIPFECQRWHLNRLLTLIRVCNIKNAPPKKMSRKDIMNRNAALNAARRAASGSKG